MFFCLVDFNLLNAAFSQTLDSFSFITQNDFAVFVSELCSMKMIVLIYELIIGLKSNKLLLIEMEIYMNLKFSK